jgi:hypothetical protein
VAKEFQKLSTERGEWIEDGNIDKIIRVLLGMLANSFENISNSVTTIRGDVRIFIIEKIT